MSTFEEVQNEQKNKDNAYLQRFEQQLDVEGSVQQEMDKLQDMTNTKVEVEQYHKSLFGYGRLTTEQEAHIAQVQRDADYLNAALTTDKLQISDETRAKLEAVQGRQMSFLLLNNFRYKTDSKEMTAVKEAIAAVEEHMYNEINIKVTPEMIRREASDYRYGEDNHREADKAFSMCELYEKAIVACKNYLDAKSPSYKKGQERWLQVRDNMKRMMQEQSRLILGLQLVRRGKIQEAKTPMDLIAQAGVFAKNQAELTEEENQKASKSGHVYVHGSTRSLTKPEDFYHHSIKNEEARAITETIFSVKTIPELFKIGEKGKLDKDQIQRRNDLKKLYTILSRFPKNKFHSETLVVGGTSFNILQVENGGLVFTHDKKMYRIPNKAEVIADRIAIGMIGMEEVMGESTTKELTSILNQEVNTNDLRELLRVEQYANAVITKRLNISNIAISNIKIEDRRRFAQALLQGTSTPEQISEFIKGIENTYKQEKETRQAHAITEQNALSVQEQGIGKLKKDLKSLKDKKLVHQSKIHDTVMKRLNISNETYKKTKSDYEAEIKRRKEKGAELAKIKEVRDNFNAAIKKAAEDIESDDLGSEAQYELALEKAAETVGLETTVPNEQILAALDQKINTFEKESDTSLFEKELTVRDAYFEKKAGVEASKKKLTDTKKKNKVAEKRRDFEIAKLNLQKELQDLQKKYDEERAPLVKAVSEAKAEAEALRKKLLTDGTSAEYTDYKRELKSLAFREKQIKKAIAEGTATQEELDEIVQKRAELKNNPSKIPEAALRKVYKDYNAKLNRLAAEEKKMKVAIENGDASDEDLEKIQRQRKNLSENPPAAIAKIRNQAVAYEAAKRRAADAQKELDKTDEEFKKSSKYMKDALYSENVAPLEKVYNEAKKSVDTAEKELRAARDSVDAIFNSAKDVMLTEEEKNKNQEALDQINSKISQTQSELDTLTEAYESVGGEEKVEELKEEIEQIKLDKDETVTDTRINDASTTEKLRLYEENKYKYDQMIKFDIEADEKDKDSLLDENAKKNEQTWTEQEQAIVDMLADFIYDSNTWAMDKTVNDPGARVSGVLGRHTQAIAIVLTHPEVLSSVIDRLPMMWLDGGAEQNQLFDQALTGGFDPENANVTVTSKREELKKTIQSTFETLKTQMPEEMTSLSESILKAEKAPQEIADRIYELEDQIKKAEANIEKLKQKEEELRKKGEEIPTHEVKRTGFGAGLFSFFGGSDTVQKTDLQLAQEELEKLKEECQKLEDAEEETEDKIQAAYNNAGLKISFGLLHADAKKAVAKFEKSLRGALDSFLNVEDLQKQMSQTIDEIFPEDEVTTDYSKIKSPKEKNISEKEKEKRIDEGNEALANIIRDSMQGSEGQGKFIKNVMKNYIFGIHKIDMRSMMASALRNAKPLSSNFAETNKEKDLESMASILGGAFKGAGPLMHKILQGIPEQMLPPGMIGAIKDMKSNLSPIPMDVVKAELASIIERSEGRISNIIVKKSLGAASIGQAFLCDVFVEGVREECVVKILRPDVRNKMERESSVMIKSAKEAGEGMYYSYKGMLEIYKKELDFTIEAKNAALGHVYEKGGKGVDSMEVLNLAPASTNSLVLKRARGETIDHMLDTMKQEYEYVFKPYYEKGEDGKVKTNEDGVPALKLTRTLPDLRRVQRRMNQQLKKLRQAQERMTTLANRWVTEGVFGGGFYHGDLHAGNIMVSNFNLTVIDYGNATQLTKFQQENITIMMVAAAAGDMEGFRECFRKLLENTPPEVYKQKEADLGKAIKEVFALGDSRSAGQRIAAALLRAQKLGFEIPTSIFNFSQCQLRLQNTIDDMNTQIKMYQEALGQLEKVEDPISFDLSADVASVNHFETQTIMKSALLSDTDESIKMAIRLKDPKQQAYFKDYTYCHMMSVHDYATNDERVDLFMRGMTKEYTLTVSPERIMGNLDLSFSAALNKEQRAELFALVKEATDSLDQQFPGYVEQIKLAEAEAKAKAKAQAQANGQADFDEDEIIIKPEKITMMKPNLDKLKAKIKELAASVDHVPLLTEYQKLLAENKDPDKDPRMIEIEKKLIPIMKTSVKNFKENFEDLVKCRPDTEISMYESYKNKLMLGDGDFSKKELESKMKKTKESRDKTTDELLKKYKPGCFEEKLKETLRDTDPEIMQLAKNDLQKFFDNKELGGEKLKDLYDRFRATQDFSKKMAESKNHKPEEAQKYAQEAEDLLNQFVSLYATVASLTKAGADDVAKGDSLNYDKSKPDDFLIVMGEVIMDNKMKAVKRLGSKVAKYTKALASE